MPGRPAAPQAVIGAGRRPSGRTPSPGCSATRGPAIGERNAGADAPTSACARLHRQAARQVAPPLGQSARQMTLDWLAQTRKGCFGSGYWSFYVPGRGFVSFSFTQLGLRFHPVGASFRFFLPFSLAVLPPPFYHPASGFIGVPPGSQDMGFEPVPFRASNGVGLVSTNPATQTKIMLDLINQVRQQNSITGPFALTVACACEESECSGYSSVQGCISTSVIALPGCWKFGIEP